MAQYDNRYLRQLELASSQKPGMAGDDASLCVDQDWIGEPKLGDAIRNLPDLVVRMRTGVPLVGDKPLDRPELNTLRHFGGNRGTFHKVNTPVSQNVATGRITVHFISSRQGAGIF